MKNWIKKNCKMILIMLGFIILGPIIINLLFKVHPIINVFVAEWDASAALSYYGAIVSSVIAIYGIYITIHHSQENYKEDVRNRTLPFIVIDMLKTGSHKRVFPSSNLQTDLEPVEGYREYKLTDYYCILENGEIEYRMRLTKTQQELLDNGGTEWVSGKNGGSRRMVDEICVPFEIENVGNGTAIRIRYGLNRKETSAKDRKFLPPMSLKPSIPIMFHLFSEDCSRNSSNLGEYILSFCYEDIYLNRYEQHFDIIIEYSKEKNTPIVSVDMSHVQNFLGGN